MQRRRGLYEVSACPRQEHRFELTSDTNRLIEVECIAFGPTWSDVGVRVRNEEHFLAASHS